MSTPTPPRAQPILRRAGTLLATLAIVAAAVAGVAASLTLIAAEPERQVAEGPARVPVGVMTVKLDQSYAVTRHFTGQIEAEARVDLGFELPGRVTDILVEEGDLVPAGATLARLDTSALVPERAALQAELAALAASAELARLTLARNDALTERGFRSVAAQDEARLTVAQAEARMDTIHAQLAGLDVRLDKSTLTAPFAARIGARLAEPGQTAGSGQPVLVLFKASPARARVGLPPDLAATLRVGQTVQIDLGTGQTDATIRQIRPDLDPATRSRLVVLDLPDQGAAIPGETVRLILTQQVAEPGFWAPLSALREGVRGSWSVMALDTTAQGDRTHPAAVEVIHTDGDRVFLRGTLPPGARIVATAPDRVAPGQIVLAQGQ